MSKIAVVTGASSGIGKEFSRQLARKGYDLIILGRRRSLLEKVAYDIKRDFNVKVEIRIFDLSNEEDLDTFINEIRGKDNIEFLVNNAGYGELGTFTGGVLKDQIEMIDVHIKAAVKLCHVVGVKMKQKKKGYIINLSSISGFILSQAIAMYCTTKGFLASFSEYLALELKPYNIKVQALCPGFTKTDFHKKLNISENSTSKWMSPCEVVSISLKNIEKNLKVIVIPGIGNKMLYMASRILPKSIHYRIAIKLS